MGLFGEALSSVNLIKKIKIFFLEKERKGEILLQELQSDCL